MQLWPSCPLQASSVNLYTYSGDRVGVLGGLDVNVSYGDQNAKLSLLVVEGSESSLFRRDCLASMTQPGLDSDLHGHLPSSGGLAVLAWETL